VKMISGFSTKKSSLLSEKQVSDQDDFLKNI